MTRLALAAGLLIAAASTAAAQQGETAFGVRWGQSPQEVADAAQATVVSRTVHQRYGTAYELDRLPIAFGGEIHRILYFDDDGQLHRVWIDFGHPGGIAWEENYLLDEAIAKYRELKADVGGRGGAGECAEPELEHVEEEGRTILDRHKFRRNKTVWSCAFDRGPTQLEVSMRRLGDTPGERFDVVFIARDKAAVEDYQNQHRLRRPE